MKGIVPLHLFDFQHEIIKGFHEHRNCIVLTARQMGKSLDVETPVMTPHGFVRLGDLKVGDVIYGQDGRRTQITFITDTMVDRPCYRIEFRHGDTIISDAEHLWTINLPGYRKPHKKTVTTLEMIDLINYYNSLSGKASISIDHCEVLEFNDTVLPIDPYMFGVWLGDGNIRDNRITCHVDDADHYINAARDAGLEPSAFRPDKRRPTTGSIALGRLFTNQLRAVGFGIGNGHSTKDIPDEFIFTSVDQRLALLRGLMDTDGTVEKNGVCRFYQSNKTFIEKVRLLLSTLGIKSTLRVKKTSHRDCYILTFSTNKEVASLTRKRSRLTNLKHHPKNTRIYI